MEGKAWKGGAKGRRGRSHSLTRVADVSANPKKDVTNENRLHFPIGSAGSLYPRFRRARQRECFALLGPVQSNTLITEGLTTNQRAVSFIRSESSVYLIEKHEGKLSNESQWGLWKVNSLIRGWFDWSISLLLRLTQPSSNFMSKTEYYISFGKRLKDDKTILGDAKGTCVITCLRHTESSSWIVLRSHLHSCCPVLSLVRMSACVHDLDSNEITLYT